MKKATLAIMVLILLLSACGTRDPYRVGFLYMRIDEMFPDDGRIRALAIAASDGDIKRIDRLVASGVDVNAVGRRGLPAAFWVLYHPNKEGFRRLLEHGADPNRFLKYTFGRDKREYYKSIVHAAAGSSKYYGVDCLNLVLEVGRGNPNLSLPDGWRPIQEAVSVGMEESFALLYNAGAEIDYSDDYDSLLGYALYAGNYELALFLLEQGVDYRKKDNNGRDPRSILTIKSNFSSWEILDNQWFWRCVNFYEKRDMPVEIPGNIKRPKILDTTPPEILKLTTKR